MAGTAVGARKGWKTRKAVPPHEQRRREMVNRDRLAMRAEAAERSGGYVSGLKINLQTIDEEYVPALKRLDQRVDLYDRMANDADVKAQLRANILPLMSAVRWKVEGGDERMRELVAANLLREGPRKFWCETSWKQRLFEILQCLKYGFAIFGKTREIVDGRMIFRRLTYLHPRSLRAPNGPWEWDRSGTSLVALHRTYSLPTLEQVVDETIPIQDLFIACWEMTGENWEGVSMIRPAYKHWTMKELAEKIGMIALQNAGVPIPDGELAPGDGPKQAATMERQLKDMRGGSKERAFNLRAPGQKLGYLTGQAGVDASPLVNMHRAGIAATGGTQFLGAGQTESGSRASDSVHLIHYLQVADAVREIVQEQINHGAGYLQGLVEELVDANSDEVDEYPQIVGSRVSPTEQLDNVPLIGEQVQRGSITHDLTVENHCRKSLGVKELTQDEFDDLQAKQRNIGGRPPEVGDFDREEPRDDTAGRRFGLRAQGGQAEKKTLGAIPRRRNGASYPWLR